MLKALFAIALLVVTAPLCIRAAAQHFWASRLALVGPLAIHEERFVRIGGVDQWVSIRGRDRTNPLLVIVHGGPGSSLLPLAYERLLPWEAHFTVVQWDQRGAGRTYSRNRTAGGASLSITQIASDGVEVLQHALSQTGHKKAVLLGASWGSIVGVRMARLRPDLLHAYVGAGQVVDMSAGEALGYRMLLDRVEAAGDVRAQAELKRIGPPPYADLREVLAERRVLFRFPPASEEGLQGELVRRLIFAPGLSLRGAYDTLAAQLISIRHLYGELSAYADPMPPAPLAARVVFIQGEADAQTPTPLVQAYADSLPGAEITFVRLPGGGHLALLALADDVLDVLLREVRPHAVAGDPAG